VDGAAIVLGRQYAQNFSLVLHELAPNAIKHGALSNLDGRVHIWWDVRGNGGGSQLIFHWREQRGPPVGDPERQGFGATLLRTTFANSRSRSTLAGSVSRNSLKRDFAAPSSGQPAGTSRHCRG
jgi:two-component sensor histidine kinase